MIKRRDLIPNKDKAKGTFNFNDQAITILNDKWVFAQYEDGYFVGDMLLEYSLINKEKINWKILSHRID